MGRRRRRRPCFDHDKYCGRIFNFNLEDRISDLPDEILINHILCALTLKEAAATSILSRRWVLLWTYSTRLDFYSLEALYKLDPKYTRDKVSGSYISWVNRVLRSHKSATLDQFRICYDLNDTFKNKIDNWLIHAFTRKVQRLELDLSVNQFNRPNWYLSYEFPLELLLDRGRWNFFDCIKSLCFEYVDVSVDAINFFFENFPFLERLVVNGSTSLFNFDSASTPLPPALKYLELCHCNQLRTIDISDTNLVSIKMISADTEPLSLKNVPLLVEAYIGVGYLCTIPCRLYHCFCQLEVLTLDFTVSRRSLKFDQLPEFSKLRKLELIVYAKKEDNSVLGYTCLIRASPYLETFTLRLRWRFFAPRYVDLENEVQRNCPIRYLKVIELLGYCGCTGSAELVDFFVENCVALERLIVDPRSQEDTFNMAPRKENSPVANYCFVEQLQGSLPSHIDLVIL